eukprot:1208164-Ditylum_brightwellii.AAC.1
MSHYPNIASTGGFVPMYRWNTSPSVSDKNSVHNLMDGIDFDAPFLPDSTDDNSNKDAFSYHNNFFPEDIYIRNFRHYIHATYVTVGLTYVPNMEGSPDGAT